MTTSIPVPRLFHLLNAQRRQRLTTYRNAFKSISAYSFEHFLFLGGLAAMAYGVWLWWHPAGFMAGGWFALKMALSKKE